MRIFIIISVCFISLNTMANEKKVLESITSFSKELKIELEKGLKKSPQEAIKICNIMAPKIALKMSKDSMRIGRVSLKNRNLKNYPKKWMIESIKKFHKKEIETPYVVINLDGHKKGLLKPIVTMPVCLKCHGPNISSEIQTEIKKLYPQDKAIGYNVGDIRGFFWAIYKD